MWETEWADKKAENNFGSVLHESIVDRGSIAAVYGLHWSEHCMECAVPECYRVCRLYVPRKDNRCARLVEGIVPDRSYQGLFDFGANVKFRRWGKLEARLGTGELSLDRMRLLQNGDFLALNAVNLVSDLLQPLSPTRKANTGYVHLRRQILKSATSPVASQQRAFDEFVMEAWNLGSIAFRLAIEVRDLDNNLRFRTSFEMLPGHNLHRVPFTAMNTDLVKGDGWISVFPENDFEAHLVFTWLDFVRYRNRREPARISPTLEFSARKIKCVVWDLDNTIWHGILGEVGLDGIRIRPDVVKTVKELARRGILQSIASKNDLEHATQALRNFGLHDYFLFPAINWGQKSENIRQIAKELNLGIDSFAFIDDSQFELAEVKSAIPEISVYPESDLPGLLTRPEFDVPITEESRNRREYYLAESSRRQIVQQYGADYEQFLKSCEMEAKIFIPKAKSEIERCLELLHRSNQLNLTTRRLSEQELQRILQDPQCVALGVSCWDRFGEYGIVGFLSIHLDGNRALLSDFVLSCRVAKKKVENAVFAYLLQYLGERSYQVLHATFLPTSRNHVLLTVLKEVGFQAQSSNGTSIALQLSCGHLIPAGEIVKIDAEFAGVPETLKQ